MSVFSVDELCPKSLPVHVFRSEAQWRSQRVWHAIDRLLQTVSTGSFAPLASIEFPDYDGLGFATIKAARLGLGSPLPPLVVRIHGTVESTARGDGRVLLSIADKQRARMERYALRHADRVIAPSEEIVASYRSDYRLADDVAIEPLPVTLPPSVLGVRRESTFSSLPLRVGFLGKLQPIKGAEVLVRAVCARLEAEPELPIEVHLVGADERGRFGESHLAELQRWIPSRARHAFHFHGALPREVALAQMAKCHAGVLPSRSETFGLAARELAALGLPLAVTSIPGFRGGLGRGAASVEFFEIDAVTDLERILERWTRSLARGSWPPEIVERPPTRRNQEADVQGRVARPPVRRLPSGVGVGMQPDRMLERSDAAPRISIVIPFFEMQEYVDDCLDSVECDPWQDKEILVIDDGSVSAEAQASLDRVRRRFDADSNRRVLVKPNGGLGSARNFGISQARGEFVLPLDPDDLIVPGFLGAAVRALDRVAELAYVVGISSLFRDGEDPQHERDWIVPYDPDRGMLFYENGAGTAAAVFRRSVLQSFPYREDLPAYEDWDLYLQLATAGLEGEGLPIVTHRYRQRRDGLARLAHRHHDRLLSVLLEPYLAQADPDLRAALEIYLASVTRMRGLGVTNGPVRERVADWVEAFYRRRLKTWMSDRLGEARRDQVAAAIRRLLTGR